MKRTVSNRLSMAIRFVCVCLCTAQALAHPVRGPRERDVKAAYLYRFLFFTSWPEGAINGQVVIGIVGTDPFGSAFAAIENKKTGPGARLVKVRRFGVKDLDRELPHCHLLFISQASSSQTRAILEKVGTRPILTVSDGGGFLEQGGVVALVRHRETIRWEINRAVANRAGLRMGAQLLRNALRVLEDGDASE